MKYTTTITDLNDMHSFIYRVNQAITANNIPNLPTKIKLSKPVPASFEVDVKTGIITIYLG